MWKANAAAALGTCRYKINFDKKPEQAARDMDRLFEGYAELLAGMQDHFRRLVPKAPQDSDFVYRSAIKAKALDAVRGVLPAGALSNVGVYGSGQAYEALVLRLRANPLPEAQAYAELMMAELRKVIPSFLRRLDLPERGGVWADYLASTRAATEELAERWFPPALEPVGPEPVVRLVDFDPDGEEKVLAAMLYPYVDRSHDEIRRRVGALSATERVELVRAYCGVRSNRRHRPGRRAAFSCWGRAGAAAPGAAPPPPGARGSWCRGRAPAP